jgi:hypothetical protein
LSLYWIVTVVDGIVLLAVAAIVADIDTVVGAVADVAAAVDYVVAAAEAVVDDSSDLVANVGRSAA